LRVKTKHQDAIIIPFTKQQNNNKLRTGYCSWAFSGELLRVEKYDRLISWKQNTTSAAVAAV
jgi:hypothetical protein